MKRGSTTSTTSSRRAPTPMADAPRDDADRPAPWVSSATLHEAAGRVGALPSRLAPLVPTMRVRGPAFTVQCAVGDNLRIHHAMKAASAGDVLVVATASSAEYGYWGELMTVAAAAARLGGLVIDGHVRDYEQLVTIGFPIFARGRCIRGTVKHADAPGWLARPIMIGDVRIAPGDLVVGDADGVVVIDQARADEALQRSIARDQAEAVLREQLAAGGSTVDVLDLPQMNDARAPF